jgi:type IV secretion system protein VirD4
MRLLFSIIVCAVAFFIFNRLTGFTATEIKAGANPARILPRFPEHLADRPFFIDTSDIALIVGLVVVALIGLVGAYHLAKPKNHRPGEEHGSAKWANSSEMKPYTTKDTSNRLQLTQTEALSLDTRKTGRNLNVCVLGASGSWKTRGYLIPNLEKIDGVSFGISDPKAEIYRQTRYQLIDRGYEVRAVNFVDLKESEQFNPYVYFSATEPETSVMQLAQGIIQNTAGKKPAGGGDQFWDRAEQSLLSALVAYKHAEALLEERIATLPGVLDLHRKMGVQHKAAKPADPENGIPATEAVSKADQVFNDAQELVQDAHESGEELPLALKVMDFACRQYAIFKQGPEVTRRSVMICLGVRLAPLDMHDVRHIFSGDTVQLGQMGETPSAVFLIVPDTHDTFRFASALFWQAMFSHNVYLADHTETGTLHVPIHCFLDEFANIGMIPNFERLIATIRSRGISVSLLVQNFAQGKAVWREHWATIVGNCDSVLFLGGRDEETNQWLSKQLGSETLHVEDRSESRGRNASTSRSWRKMKRELMTADEIGRLPNDEALLLIRGLRPFKSKKAVHR